MIMQSHIIFNTQAEFTEFKDLLCLTPARFAAVTEFPYLMLLSGGGQIVSTWGKPSVFAKVKAAFLWSEIRTSYIPEKKWYDRIANAGKVTMVRNSESQQWQPDTFRRYNKQEELLVCENGYWKYAKEIPAAAVKLDYN